MFNNSLTYLKEAMKNKIPVMVGLDYKLRYANDDLTTDHFAVITGCGRDQDGLYFHVLDNAYSSRKFYCNCLQHTLETKDQIVYNYPTIISQIRESYKL